MWGPLCGVGSPVNCKQFHFAEGPVMETPDCNWGQAVSAVLGDMGGLKAKGRVPRRSLLLILDREDVCKTVQVEIILST